jgi:16S rRNA processing protein RimM
MLPEWNWTVGQVVGTFGIRGEMKVRIESDFPDRFAGMKQICLRPARGEPRLFRIETARLHKGAVLLKLEGVDRIEDVEPWRGARVQTKKEDAVRLPEDAYYFDELVGMEVFTRDGRRIGPIEQVLPYPAQDLWQVGEALIPAVKPIVVSVDRQARRIVIDPPEGLLPGEQAETVE